MPFSAPSTTAGDAAATKACRDRLAATGIDLASYTTAENAADIADLRVAMGIPSWDVYGVSYGLTSFLDDPTRPVDAGCAAQTRLTFVT